MKQIRNKIFETNSSSTHAITFSIDRMKSEGNLIINCPCIFTRDFDCSGNGLGGNISLVFLALLRGIYDVPIVCPCDSYCDFDDIEEGEFKDEFKGQIEEDEDDELDCEIVIEYFKNVVDNFLVSEDYKAFLNYLTDLGYNVNLKNIFGNSEAFYNKDKKGVELIDYPIIISGTSLIYEYIEWNKETHTCNLEKLKKFIETSPYDMSRDVTIWEA